MAQAIDSIIETELERFGGEETLANALRCAAWVVMDELPAATSKDFGDAAARLGLHRQSSMNRWNEAKRNLEIAAGK